MSPRRPWRYLTESKVAEVERRLALYRCNTPQRIAAELGLHPNTVSKINLGRHPLQAGHGRIATAGMALSRLSRRADR